MESGKDKMLQTLELDKTGGNTGSGLHAYRFDFERKSEFLRLAIEFWPNLSKICAVVGISRQCFYDHMKSDKLFNKALQDVDAMICDEHEEMLRQEGMKPKGFLDRMAYLRAHRPELYDRAKVVRVEGYKMTDGEAQRRLARLDGAIDATIVQSYTTRKERLRLKQQQVVDNSETGKTGGGEAADGKD